MTVMESYLMMLYVTLEQESALKNFFIKQGWTFSKPDMTVTTDKLGPSVQNAKSENHLSTTSISSTLTGKRKLKVKQKAPIVKMAKIVSSKSDVSNTQAGAKVEPDVKRLNEFDDVSLHDEETGSDCNLPISDAASEVKKENFSMSFNPENEDGLEEEGVENIEETDTDADYNFEETEEKIEADDNEMEVKSDDNRREIHTEAEKARGQRQSKTVGKGTDKKMAVKCFECLKEFACKGNLKKHMVRHGEKRIKCSICRKGFFRMDELRQHFKHIHDEDAPCIHMCDACGNTYKSKSALQSHFAYKHRNTKQKDVECTICGKKLSSKRKRLLHERTHKEDISVMRCAFCKKMYVEPEEHFEECSYSSELKKFPCSVCESIFLEERYLKQHIKHKHIKVNCMCPSCNKIFSDYESFSDHKLLCEYYT